jgi:hypothetical protein
LPLVHLVATLAACPALESLEWEVDGRLSATAKRPRHEGVDVYTGAASRAGLSYAGAVLGTPDGAYPQAHAARIDAALRRAGIEPWELSFVDNSACAGAPLVMA